MGRCLLLLSGGVESAVLLRQLLAKGKQPVPLCADYAQRAAREELRAAQAACRHAGIAEPQVLDLRAEGEAFWRANGLHVPLPHRNLVLLSLGLGWATTHCCTELALGLNKDDFAKDAEFAGTVGAVRYTTGTRRFVEDFRRLAATVAPGIEVTLPQAELTKHQVVLEGLRLGTNLAETYSCMRGRPRHCGACLQCRARREAFRRAAAEEPAGFYAADPP